MIRVLRDVLHKGTSYTRDLRDEKRQTVFEAAVARVLADPTPPEPYDSEEIFASLQEMYGPWGEYCYDHYAKWERATGRALRLLQNERLQRPNQVILEVACGDGNVGYCLSQYPHQIVLSDYDDWRDEHVRSLPFVRSDICHSLPLEHDSFDAVISYNAFEHFEDPQAAFDRIVTVCKPGGLICLSFGPLYASPFGLHAYRTLRMPYSQFLFSEEFVNVKLRQLGIRDLGRQLDALQPLNQWRLEQFERLWSDGRTRVIGQKHTRIDDHLDLALRFPRAFQGRRLTIKDLRTATIDVRLNKL